VRGHVGLLDWYTVSVAVLAVVMLAAHGATYLTLKTEGPVHDRCEIWAKYLWIAVVPLLAVVLIESRIVRPDLPGRALFNPFWWLGLIVIAASAFTLLTGLTSGRELRPFVGSNFLIVGLLATGTHRACRKRNALNFPRATRSRRAHCCGVKETRLQRGRSAGHSSSQ